MIINYKLNKLEKGAALKLAAALDIDVKEISKAMVADDYDLVTTGLYIHEDGAVDFTIRYDAAFVCSALDVLTKHASKIKQAYKIIESGFGLLISLFQDIDTDLGTAARAVVDKREVEAKKKRDEKRDEKRDPVANFVAAYKKEYDAMTTSGLSHDDAVNALYAIYSIK